MDIIFIITHVIEENKGKNIETNIDLEKVCGRAQEITNGSNEQDERRRKIDKCNTKTILGNKKKQISI